MVKRLLIFAFVLGSLGCKKKTESIVVQNGDITESVYASGVIKSVNQYQVYATVNGILDQIHVSEGDTVNPNTLLFSVLNPVSSINRENAELNAEYSDYNGNLNKINDLKTSLALAIQKMYEDSLLYARQSNLWQQDIGSKLELEQKELAFRNSSSIVRSTQYKLKDLEKQLKFSANQSRNNLNISRQIEKDYRISSQYQGKVYSILKEKGELVSPQMPLAVIGDANVFVLELQVDEFDIAQIKIGQEVFITLDSYKDSVFEARVSKIYPIMNERSKTFTIEAHFVRQPPRLFPNLTVEANIVLQSKKNTLCIPRKYLINDSFVLDGEGKKIAVKTGLKDYAKVEIISGLQANQQLMLPKQ